MTPEEIQQATSDFQEIPVAQSGRRLGVQWTPWMGDWFTSWSPRNGNNHAEGTWEEWVDLAVRILQDPMTALVRQDAHEAVAGVGQRDFAEYEPQYTSHDLTEDELRDFFAPRKDFL